MNEEQVDELLGELARTRDSFDSAIGAVKWNKINTFIQYCLIAIVFLFGALGIRYYVDDRHDTCVAGNEFRRTMIAAQEKYALNFATALAAKLKGDEQDVQDFMDIYGDLPVPEVLITREC